VSRVQSPLGKQLFIQNTHHSGRLHWVVQHETFIFNWSNIQAFQEMRCKLYHFLGLPSRSESAPCFEQTLVATNTIFRLHLSDLLIASLFISSFLQGVNWCQTFAIKWRVQWTSWCVNCRLACWSHRWNKVFSNHLWFAWFFPASRCLSYRLWTLTTATPIIKSMATLWN